MARQQDDSILLYSGVESQVITVQEGTTAASYVANDLIRFESTGQVILATNAVIAGIATEAATGSTGGVSDVQDMALLDPTALYIMTAASAVAPTQAMVGDPYNLDFTAGGHWVETTSTTPEVYIVGLYPEDYTGSAYTAGGRYIIRFLWKNFAPQ